MVRQLHDLGEVSRASKRVQSMRIEQMVRGTVDSVAVKIYLEIV